MDKKILNEDILDVVKELNSFKQTNKTFLITGASGTLGSLLILSILENNAINKTNNNIIAATTDVSKTNREFEGFKNISFVSYSENIKQHVDYIIHFASPTNSKYFVRYPIETYKTIVMLTDKYLNLAKKMNARFVYISSMEVYGTLKDKKLKTENELGFIPLDSARSSYPLGKRAAEALCNFYYNEHNVDIRIARLAQTFGAGSRIDDPRIFSYAANCVLNNKDIVLKTDGQSYGNYVYLSDCLRAILIVLFKGKSGETYNVVNKKTNVKIIDFCKLVACKKVNVVVKKTNNFYPENTNLKMSSKKIYRIGWKPKYNLKQMTERLLKYFGN